MKKFKLGALLTMFAMALFIFSCGEGHSHDEDGGNAEETSQTDENSENTENAEVDLTSPEYASAFICPMHCKGSGSDAAGTCPVCGMDYVANENYKSNSEAAEESHSEEGGHDDDGDSHEGHNH